MLPLRVISKYEYQKPHQKSHFSQTSHAPSKANSKIIYLLLKGSII